MFKMGSTHRISVSATTLAACDCCGAALLYTSTQPAVDVPFVLLWNKNGSGGTLST